MESHVANTVAPAVMEDSLNFVVLDGFSGSRLAVLDLRHCACAADIYAVLPPLGMVSGRRMAWRLSYGLHVIKATQCLRDIGILPGSVVSAVRIEAFGPLQTFEFEVDQGADFEVLNTLTRPRLLQSASRDQVRVRFIDTSAGHLYPCQVMVKRFTGLLHGSRLPTARLVLKEMRLLKRMQDVSCVQSLRDIYPPAPDADDLYITQEFMDADLEQVLRGRYRLADDHCMFFTYHLLHALSYLHALDVAHGHLQPCHVLLNRNDELKLCDFALARASGIPDNATSCDEPELPSTGDLGMSIYAAPDRIAYRRRFVSGAGLDLWAAGLIVAEMSLREPSAAGGRAAGATRRGVPAPLQ